jgi:hypothetical protein
MQPSNFTIAELLVRHDRRAIGPGGPVKTSGSRAFREPETTASNLLVVRRYGAAKAAFQDAKRLSAGSASSAVNRESKRNRVAQ